MDLGQGRGDWDFHSVGNKRGGDCSSGGIPTFRIKGVGQREMG